MTKTPIDNGTPGATLALLNGSSDFQMMDLWAVTLNGGTVVRWHSGQISGPMSFNGAVYTYGPDIDRGKISTKLGLEVATLDMTVSATASDLINGVPLIPFAQGRGFDGATVVLYRAFLPNWQSPVTGAVIAFSGRVTQLKDVSRAKFTMTVSAWTVLLNVNMGPDIFQAGCLNSHYDADCGLTPTNVAGTVSSGATTLAFNTSLSNPDHYFDKGTVTFTSGANAGLSRAVSTYLSAGGAMTVAFPLPNAPAIGDAFNAVRGCLLTMADCTAQANLLHFRGQPFTPAAVNAITGLPGS
jgi:uncharacterized phage protein (TIGR02218 family)